MRSLLKKMEHGDRVIADQIINLETEYLLQQRLNAKNLDELEQKRLSVSRELQDVYQSLWRAQSQADFNLQWLIVSLVSFFIIFGYLVYTL